MFTPSNNNKQLEIMKTKNNTNDINNYLNLKWHVMKALNTKPEWQYVSLRNTGLTGIYKANR